MLCLLGYSRALPNALLSCPTPCGLLSKALLPQDALLSSALLLLAQLLRLLRLCKKLQGPLELGPRGVGLLHVALLWAGLLQVGRACMQCLLLHLKMLR